MTAPRLPHHRSGGSTSSRRDEKPRPPCAGRWDVYESLMEPGTDPESLEAAQNMCATCLLRTPATAKACLDAARGQRWRQLVLGRPVEKPVTKRRRPVAKCGTESGYARHKRNKETACDECKAANTAGVARRTSRLEDLRELIAQGAGVEEVCDRLSVTRDGLWKWCDRHNLRDEWAALSPPKPEAIVKIRRKRDEVAA